VHGSFVVKILGVSTSVGVPLDFDSLADMSSL